MEELLYKQLFYQLKQMLHNPKFGSILISNDNQILNFLELAISEAFVVWKRAEYGEVTKDE